MRTSGNWQRVGPSVLVVACLACDLGPGVAVIQVSAGPRAARVAAAALAAQRGRGDPEIRVIERTEGLLPHAVDVAETMVQDDAVIGVVGPSGSGDAVLTAPIFQRVGVVQVLPTANAPELYDAGQWTFVLAPTLEDEADLLAATAADRGASAATVFYTADPYGRGLAAALDAALAARGVTTADRAPLPSLVPCRESGEGPVLETLIDNAMRRAPSNVILVAGRSDQAGCVIATARARGVQSPILLSDGAPLGEALARAGRGREWPDVLGVTFWVAGRSEESRAFEAAFAAEYGRSPSIEEAYSYDAIMLIGTAVQEVGKRRDAVRRWLRGLGTERPPFRGVTGHITFPVSPTGRLILVDAP